MVSPQATLGGGCTVLLLLAPHSKHAASVHNKPSCNCYRSPSFVWDKAACVVVLYCSNSTALQVPWHPHGLQHLLLHSETVNAPYMPPGHREKTDIFTTKHQPICKSP